MNPDDETSTPGSPRVRLRVTKSNTEVDRDFWEVVERTSAATLHTDQIYEAPWHENRTRHRAVDIDVTKLLADSVFGPECRDELARLHEDDCVVLIPDHDAAERLRSLGEEAIGLSPAAVNFGPRSDPLS